MRPKKNLGAYFREDNGRYVLGNTSHHNKEEHMKQFFPFQFSKSFRRVCMPPAQSDGRA